MQNFLGNKQTELWGNGKYRICFPVNLLYCNLQNVTFIIQLEAIAFSKCFGWVLTDQPFGIFMLVFQMFQPMKI